MVGYATAANSGYSGPSGKPRVNSRSGSTQVQVQPFDFDQFREFGDSVMQEYQRTTAPQIEQQRARMNQDLINRGITPGSEAYDYEMDRFMRTENDLFNTAQRSALAQGLAAQNQAFTQGLGQAQINAGLQQAGMAAAAQRAAASSAAGASRYNADQNRAGSLERLLASLNQQESEFGRNFGLAQDQFGLAQDQFGLAEGQADFANLMSLLGYGADVTNINNNALNNDRGFASGMVGGFMPGANFVPINAGGAFGTSANAQANAANAVNAGRNGLFGALGGIGSAAIGASDRNIKTDIKSVDNDQILEQVRKVPVSRWKYKGDSVEHIGPMAQDFGENITGDKNAKFYHMIDAIGTLMASVQALADRIDSMEAAR